MSSLDIHSEGASIWSRRAVLGAVAAVPAVVVPALAGPVAAAHAARGGKPVAASSPPLVIGPKASLVTGIPGPISTGLRLTLTLNEYIGEKGFVEFEKVVMTGFGESEIFDPNVITVSTATPAVATVDVVTTAQLPSTFVVTLAYSYNYGDGHSAELAWQQKVTLVPLQALSRGQGRPRKPKPHRH